MDDETLSGILDPDGEWIGNRDVQLGIVGLPEYPTCALTGVTAHRRHFVLFDASPTPGPQGRQGLSNWHQCNKSVRAHMRQLARIETKIANGDIGFALAGAAAQLPRESTFEEWMRECRYPFAMNGPLLSDYQKGLAPPSRLRANQFWSSVGVSERCVYCGVCGWIYKMACDHVTPIHKWRYDLPSGYRNNPSDEIKLWFKKRILVAACTACNSEKSCDDPEQWKLRFAYPELMLGPYWDDES